MTKQFVDQIKSTRVDHFGNKVIEETASGLGPCRYSLKPFVPGQDKRLVLSHTPFDMYNAYNQPGPIFISSEDVEEYKEVYRFPEALKTDRFKLTLIGYNSAQWMIYTQFIVDNDQIEAKITEIFDWHPEVEYLHVRSAIACCFIFKIVRG